MMKKQINIKPDLNPKQKEALRLLFDYKKGPIETLYGGGAGGGKSFLGCLWLITCCLKYPGTRWLLGRSKLKTLKTTTLKTFFEICSRFKIINGEHYNFNQSLGIITWFNGSEIILKDLFSYPSDPEFSELGGLEISGAFLDECNQISEKAKNMVMTRIRFKLDEYDLTPKLLLTCNPARNWVYNEFYKKAVDGKLEPHKRFIQALVTDNKHITKHYQANLERQDELTKKRLLFGEWDYEDDLAMFKYDNILSMFDNKFEDIVLDDSDIYETGNAQPEYIQRKNVVFSIDVARLGKDKTCIVVWEDLTIVEIKELSKMRLDEQTAVISTMMYAYGISNKDLIFDTDGVGGGLADNFRGCVEIVNNSKPINGENYQNLKTQLYFKLAEQINLGNIKAPSIKDDQRLRMIQELQVMKRENADQDGKIRMTNKEQMKVQIGRSPDISDAMAFRMHPLIKARGEVDFEFTFIDFE